MAVKSVEKSRRKKVLNEVRIMLCVREILNIINVPRFASSTTSRTGMYSSFTTGMRPATISGSFLNTAQVEISSN